MTEICGVPLSDFVIDAGVCQRPKGHTLIHWFRPTEKDTEGMGDETKGVTIALAVVAPIKFTSTKDADILTVEVDPANATTPYSTIDIPLNAESMESLDPLLDAIASGEFLSLEVIRYG